MVGIQLTKSGMCEQGECVRYRAGGDDELSLQVV
jgi:hypothetical protein